MLTLPDTDTSLRRQSAVVTHQITRSTPWSEHPQTTTNLAYQHADKGWVAAQLTEPVHNNPITQDNFRARTFNPIVLDAPVILNPLAIPKPWGQEIWFSGIEARGESSVSQGETTLPLSAYLALAPSRLVRRAEPLLLKILDPNSTPDTGCLYFETHNTKHEVYVVTHIDPHAWPRGAGAIRIGMDQTCRRGYQNDDEFRAAFLQAVERYEAVRRKIDAGTSPSLDEKEEEQARRADMDAFTAQQALGIGDVVQVTPHIPHALQHGVRVFEFQTPTYERNIISFNQRVLTQDHWDSRDAIANMSLEGPAKPHLEVLEKTPTQLIERIVDFDDFEVLRATLKPNHTLAADLSNGYIMLAILKGDVQVECAAGSVALTELSDDRTNHQAALVPASAKDAQLKTTSTGATLLIARPKAHAADKIPTE